METIDLSRVADPAVRAVLEKMKRVAQEQSRVLQEWHQQLQYGPVSGAYVPIQWQWAQPAAGPFVVAASPWLRNEVPFSFVPVAVTAAKLGADTFTFNLDDDGGNVIFPSQTVAAATTYNAAGQFTNGRRIVNSTPGAVGLDISAVGGATIYRMSVILWVKNASRIEP
jgi:hypothetical protein